MGGQHVLDRSKNALLLAAWKLADLLKKTASLPGWSSRSFCGPVLEKLFNTNFEHRTKLCDLCRLQGDMLPLPCGVGGLGNAQLFGKLNLRQSGSEAGFVQALSEW